MCEGTTNVKKAIEQRSQNLSMPANQHYSIKEIHELHEYVNIFVSFWSELTGRLWRVQYMKVTYSQLTFIVHFRFEFIHKPFPNRATTD